MNNIKNIFRNGILMAGLVALCSCSDTWDDHYDPNGGLSFDGTTMQAISADENLSEFASLLKETGFDKELKSESSYTIWAPENGFLDDPEFSALIKSGDKKEIIKRFISSHVARYAVSLGSEDQTVKLLNSKLVEMGSTANPTFGSADIVKSNISCKNGVIHTISKANPYISNIYEAIGDRQADSELDMTWYKLLEECDTFTLDENRSLSYGVDEDGLPIYVDSVTERWNRVLIGAEIFEEDSSYIAIVPSPEAFLKRYNIARDLLKFNPSEDQKKAGRVDSLRHIMAGRFAMEDLIINKNAGKNKNMLDSLVTTDYVGYSNWDQHRYYKPYAADGILSDANRADSVKCSNGVAYFMKDYPFSVTEQFFKRINFSPSEYYVNREEDPRGGARPWATVNSSETFSTISRAFVPYTVKAFLRDTVVNKTNYKVVDSLEVDTVNIPAMMSMQMLNISPTARAAAAKYSIELPSTLSGTYDIKLVTVPYWRTKGDDLRFVDASISKFYAYIFERENGEEANVTMEAGEFGTSHTAQLVADELHADGKNILTRNFDEEGNLLWSDTISLGEHTFKNAYYGMDEPGAILQLVPQGKTAEINSGVLTKYLLISKIILTPKFDENAEATENKRR